MIKSLLSCICIILALALFIVVVMPQSIAEKLNKEPLQVVNVSSTKVIKDKLYYLNNPVLLVPVVNPYVILQCKEEIVLRIHKGKYYLLVNDQISKP